MKFSCVFMKGAFRRHCLLIQWGLRLVLHSIPWHIRLPIISPVALFRERYFQGPAISPN